ncbi:transmembrane protein 72 [Chanos chanos]|uniref:Transmembrane protein 72 n=1 Tax=Chanos chanos TaxID=29144 RepID=A0A6J2V8C6_CHACN|nr:transmembrane protein 72 [Chanos chanos]
MGSPALWIVVECACRILGVSTAAVLCAVGVETLRQGDFHSLAVYLLVSSAGMMLFEMAYFVDALLAMCLPCPPTWKLIIIWKKMAKIGGFQKFLYYTLMSIVCFLHPVMVWHAIIPGTMLLVTGFVNFILSRKKKAEQSKETGEPGLSTIYVSDMGENEQSVSFFHVITGKRASFFPISSVLQSPADSTQAMLDPHHPATHGPRARGKGDKRHVRFVKGLDQDKTEMDGYHDMELETTSDKAPMIPD